MSLVFLGRGADNAALDVINEPLAAPGGQRLRLRRWKHRKPPFSLSDTQGQVEQILVPATSQSIAVVQSLWPTICGPMDRSTPGLPILHHLPELAQVLVPCISDAIQPSHPLTLSSPSALNLSQHHGLFQ